MSTEISILIPIYNEEQNIPILFDEIRKTMDKTSLKYEIIFLDDGSSDQSVKELNKIMKKGCHCIFFGKHVGKSDILSHGFKAALGKIIITLDGDLQDDPRNIPHFIQKIHEGYDMVSGWKLNRQDPLSKKFDSLIFNKVTSFFTGIDLHDFGSGFKAYRREALQDIRLFQGAHRYLPVLVHANGFRIAEIRYNHRPRSFGKSKFGVFRMLEGFVGFILILWIISLKKLSPRR